jgi:hypothetical protein
MQRRTWLKLSATSAALLALVGGVATLVQPGLDNGALTPTGKEVFRAVGRGILDKTLPEQPAQQLAALDQLLGRVEVLIAALPAHAQAEVSQLLSILGSAAGRRALAGLHTHWPEASVAQLQAALQDMRLSSLAVRQQAYAALHDITAGAYFSEPATWALLGYPGPLAF